MRRTIHIHMDAAPARDAKEILVYGLAKGATERWQEDLLSTKCKTPADVEAVKAAARRDGYHSFRVTSWNGGPPDFTKVVSRDAQPRVVARSKRGTVEEFEEAGTGKKKYFARRSNGENLGRYNSIENAKSAVESAGVMNVSSGYQGPPLKWTDL